MLSRDASGRDPNSATSRRWNLLRENGIELDIIVSARENGESQIARLRRTYREAARSLVEHRADLITAQDPFELGLVAHLLSRKFHAPFEIQDHGGFFDGQTPDEPLWFLRKHLAAFLARRAARIRTVSPKSFEKLGGEKAYLLPIGADARFAKIERHPEPGLVFTVARLIHVKRTDLLIRAVANLARNDSAIRLIVQGDGPERPALERLAQELGATDRVQFIGAGDPTPWFAKASLFVSLSQHEGWGIASVEAALAGVPVLMTDTGCARWLAERGKAKIVEDATNAASAIKDALADHRWFSATPLQTSTHEETARLQTDAWRAIVAPSDL